MSFRTNQCYFWSQFRDGTVELPLKEGKNHDDERVVG
jgi:hypothetical protein